MMLEACIEPQRTFWDGLALVPPLDFWLKDNFAESPRKLLIRCKINFDQKIKKCMSKIKNSGHDPLEVLDWALSKWIRGQNVPTFSIKEINVQHTMKLISKLGSSTAYGQDEIDSVAIKSAADYLAYPITDIVNSSIRNGAFIMKWKTSRIIPIMKAKELSHLQQSSYHPVSLLPVLSKIVEWAVQLQLQQHMEINGLFHPNSHAYCSNMSNTTAMSHITDAMYQATNQNLITSLMALDQSSAFNCVHHGTLLTKLN